MDFFKETHDSHFVKKSLKHYQDTGKSIPISRQNAVFGKQILLP